MKHILVYGDSLSWGFIPVTRQRLLFEQRWPGVLENKLNAGGRRVRIAEDCLNGRRTVWEDPFKPGRNGLEGIGPRMEIYSPLALIILMLGSNDFQYCHPFNNAWAAAQGITALVNAMRRAPLEPGIAVPSILLMCPPRIRTPRGDLAPRFYGAEQRCQGLAEAYAKSAADLGCAFFNADAIVHTSPLDGVHLDADQHAVLGSALVDVVSPLLGTGNEG